MITLVQNSLVKETDWEKGGNQGTLVEGVDAGGKIDTGKNIVCLQLNYEQLLKNDDFF